MNEVAKPIFPSTRFVGSKSKIINWIWDCVKDFDFHNVLDAFGGTSCFSYKSKENHKEVTCNDILRFNFNIGLALIENSKTKVSKEEFKKCLQPNEYVDYKTFIQKTFRGIYFTEKENQWLDIIVQNIHTLDNQYKKAILFSALGQACLIKRPFNLFHRKNLYLRFRNVERTFNNKKCWDRPFPFYFERFVDEFNSAVFSNMKKNHASNLDVFEIQGSYDLVYLDPPYMSGKNSVNYRDMYHFLDGILGYYSWGEQIDYSKKNLKLKNDDKTSGWQKKREIKKLLGELLSKFSGSVVVLSYRSDGYPSKKEIIELFRDYIGQKPQVFSIPYKYALSKKQISETLFVAD